MCLTLTHSKRHKGIWLVHMSFAVNEPFRIKLPGILPVLFRGMHAPAVDKDPCPLGYMVAVHCCIFGGASWDAEQGNVA